MAREDTRSPRAYTGKRRRTAESAPAIKGDHAAAEASGGSCCSPPSASSLCCGICLSSAGESTIIGIIDCCDHYFCFTCIREWGKVESKCPMCKRRFYSIRRPAVQGSFTTERIFEVPLRDQRPPDDSMNSFGVSTPRSPGGWARSPFFSDGLGYTSRENSDVGLAPLVNVTLYGSWSHSYGASYHGDVNRGHHGSGSIQYNDRDGYEDSGGIPEQRNHYGHQDDDARSAMGTDSREEEHDGSDGLDSLRRRDESPRYSPCRRAESLSYSPHRRFDSRRYSPHRRAESRQCSPHRGDESPPYHRGRRYGSRSDRSSSSSDSSIDGRDDNDPIDYDGESSHYSDQEGDTRCQPGTDSGQDTDASSGADIPYWDGNSGSRSTRGSTEDDREQDESLSNGSNSNDNSYEDHADHSKESSHYSDRDDTDHSQTDTDSREDIDRSSDSKSLNHGTESPSYSRRSSRRETQTSSRRRDETWSNRTGGINGTWVASGSFSQPSIVTPSYSDADQHRESASPAHRGSPETGNRSFRSSRDQETCVDFHGFQLPRNQIKYLKRVYDSQGAFWEDSVVYSRSIRTAALSSLGEVLVLAGSDWSSLSKKDLEHIVRTANDLYSFGFRLSFFDSLVEKCNSRLNLLSEIEDLSKQKAGMESRLSRLETKLDKLDKDLDEVRGGSPLPPFLAL